VIVLASEAPDRVSRLLAGLRAHATAATQIVVVANDPSEPQQVALAAGALDRAAIGGREVEVLRTATRLGHAAALNIALRRAAGELVLIADGTAWPAGDALTPLAEALTDQDVAVAGAFGVASDEPGRLRPAGLAPRVRAMSEPYSRLDGIPPRRLCRAGAARRALRHAGLARRVVEHAARAGLDPTGRTPRQPNRGQPRPRRSNGRRRNGRRPRPG